MCVHYTKYRHINIRNYESLLRRKYGQSIKPSQCHNKDRECFCMPDVIIILIIITQTRKQGSFETFIWFVNVVKVHKLKDHEKSYIVLGDELLMLFSLKLLWLIQSLVLYHVSLRYYPQYFNAWEFPKIQIKAHFK